MRRILSVGRESSEAMVTKPKTNIQMKTGACMWVAEGLRWPYFFRSTGEKVCMHVTRGDEVQVGGLDKDSVRSEPVESLFAPPGTNP